MNINEVRFIIKKIIKEYRETAVATERPDVYEPDLSSPINSDGALIEKIRNGDENAMAEIMKKYKSKLSSYVSNKLGTSMIGGKEVKSQRVGTEIEDIVMITFEKAFRHIEKFDGQYAFSTWLYRIALNTMIDHIRKWKKNDNITVSYHKPNKEGESREINIPSKEDDPNQSLEKQEKYKIVRDSLDSMNPKYGKLLKMQYLNGFSLEEIAKKTRLPLQSVKTIIFRAKKMLKQDLENKRFSLNENLRYNIRNIILKKYDNL
jgi:RNA polymerase sigma factor (sigma-70 family)